MKNPSYPNRKTKLDYAQKPRSPFKRYQKETELNSANMEQNLFFKGVSLSKNNETKRQFKNQIENSIQEELKNSPLPTKYSLEETKNSLRTYPTCDRFWTKVDKKR